jgi:AP-1 complex subunit sigma 1/2
METHFNLFFLDLQAYFILDEILIAGELQESNKKAVLRLVTTQAVYIFYLEFARELSMTV